MDADFLKFFEENECYRDCFYFLQENNITCYGDFKNKKDELIVKFVTTPSLSAINCAQFLSDLEKYEKKLEEQKIQQSLSLAFNACPECVPALSEIRQEILDLKRQQIQTNQVIEDLKGWFKNELSKFNNSNSVKLNEGDVIVLQNQWKVLPDLIESASHDTNKQCFSRLADKVFGAHILRKFCSVSQFPLDLQQAYKELLSLYTDAKFKAHGGDRSMIMRDADKSFKKRCSNRGTYQKNCEKSSDKKKQFRQIKDNFDSDHSSVSSQHFNAQENSYMKF